MSAYSRNYLKRPAPLLGMPSFSSVSHPIGADLPPQLRICSTTTPKPPRPPTPPSYYAARPTPAHPITYNDPKCQRTPLNIRLPDLLPPPRVGSASRRSTEGGGARPTDR